MLCWQRLGSTQLRPVHAGPGWQQPVPGAAASRPSTQRRLQQLPAACTADGSGGKVLPAADSCAAVQLLPQWLVSDLLVLLVFGLAVGLGRKAASAWHEESLHKEGYQEAPPADLQPQEGARPARTRRSSAPGCQPAAAIGAHDLDSAWTSMGRTFGRHTSAGAGCRPGAGPAHACPCCCLHRSHMPAIHLGRAVQPHTPQRWLS